jgi:hypothetical protein
MPKKKQTKSLKYESEKSYRWGLCMKVAKILYRGIATNREVEDLIDHLSSGGYLIK